MIDAIQVLRDLLDKYDPERQCIDVEPDPGCLDCTCGTTPNRLNTGLCAYHRAERAIAQGYQMDHWRFTSEAHKALYVNARIAILEELSRENREWASMPASLAGLPECTIRKRLDEKQREFDTRLAHARAVLADVIQTAIPVIPVAAAERP